MAGALFAPIVVTVMLAGCGDGQQAATTVTVTAPSTAQSVTAAAPAITATDQAFIQSISLFSAYWSMRSSDAASLIATARTVCNWVAEAKQVTTDAKTIIAGTATKLTLSLKADPPPYDDAKQFVMSSVNYYCTGSIE